MKWNATYNDKTLIYFSEVVALHGGRKRNCKIKWHGVNAYTDCEYTVEMWWLILL